jgi:nucleotide-binding universal stress UspA family protein
VFPDGGYLGRRDDRAMTGIVVGVNGSEASEEALRWAIGEAELRQAPLRAVHAWLHPRVGGRGYIPPELLDRGVLRDRAEGRLEAAVAEVADEHAEVELERVVAEGPAGRVLVEAAMDAELLVLGSRGRGELAGLLLGSVGSECAHDASCPVVIVHAGDNREDSQ